MTKKEALNRVSVCLQDWAFATKFLSSDIGLKKKKVASKRNKMIVPTLSRINQITELLGADSGDFEGPKVPNAVFQTVFFRFSTWAYDEGQRLPENICVFKRFSVFCPCGS